MAFSATTQWDVRTTGSDSNGGGFDTAATGTNFAMQDAAQIAFTDLVIDATTNTKCTSAAHPFGATSPGNIINITGGTGFTVQRVQVVSVTGVTATCDKSLGTLSSTGGTGNLGGGLATIGAANTLFVSSNTLNIKAGTYTQTTAIVISSTLQITTWLGYGTTWADGGTRPLITTATNSTHLITTGSTGTGYQVFDNLSLSNTAGTKANGIQQLVNHGGNSMYWIVRGCLFDGFQDGLNSDNAGAHWDIGNIALIRTEIKNCAGTGCNANSTTRCWVQGCYLHNNTGDNVIISGTLFMDHSISVNSGAAGVNTGNGAVYCTNCTIANNTGKGIWMSASSPTLEIYNTIIFGNQANNNIVAGTGNQYVAGALISRNNAYVSGANGQWNGSPGDVTITGDPFTNAAAGDYSLNSTAGRGAACKGAGYPGVFPAGTSTGTLDIGAVQSAGSSGGGQISTPGGS